MPAEGMEFSNRAATELYDLLVRRAKEELSEQPGFDQFTAALGAALLVVANVLRAPVERGEDPDKLIAVSSRWIRTFLEPAIEKAREKGGGRANS